MNNKSGTQESPAVMDHDKLLGSPRNHDSRQRKLSIILLVLVIGFFCSLLYHYERACVSPKPYPYNTFLFIPSEQFGDFFPPATTLESLYHPDRNSIGWGSVTLMAHCYLRSHISSPPYGEGSLVFYSVYVLVFLGSLFFFVQRTIKPFTQDCLWAKTLILSLCSYPVLYQLDRGNDESIIFIALGLSMFLYQKGKTRISAVWLGLAIAMKPYSVVYLPIFLSDRKFKEIFISLGVTILTTIAALFILPLQPHIILNKLIESQTAYLQAYVVGNEGLYGGSSLYGLIKVVAFMNKWFVVGMYPADLPAFIQKCMSWYFFAVIIIFSVIAFIICLFKMDFWKKVALVVCSMNLLPYVCGDYRLIHLIIPMLLFIQVKQTNKSNWFFSMIFALLLIPTSYLHFDFDQVFAVRPYEISDSAIFHPVLMIALVFGILISVFYSPKLNDTGLWLAGFLNNTFRLGLKLRLVPPH